MNTRTGPVSTLSKEEALEALNELRSNVIATQNASWSNVAYPLVAILNAAGYELFESTTEQRHQHVACYGGAGGFPGRLRGEPQKQPGWRRSIKGQRENELEDFLRRTMVKLEKRGQLLWAKEIREFLKEHELDGD